MRWRAVGWMTGVLAIVSCRPGDERVSLGDLIPRAVGQWKATARDQTYDRQTIFKYIDGAGEVYLQYDFQSVVVREFEKTGAPRVTAQLFDMGDPEDAYGMFSFEREEPAAGIGTESEYAAGLLRFWKYRYLVCVSAEMETDDSRAAVMALGKEISVQIRGSAPPPELVRALPPERLVREQIRYFHTPFCLTYHQPIDEPNRLGLGADTDAALAVYRDQQATARLLLVRYADETRAPAAHSSFRASFDPPLAESGLAQGKDGHWASTLRVGRTLILVFDATDEAMARELMDKTRMNLEAIR